MLSKMRAGGKALFPFGKKQFKNYVEFPREHSSHKRRERLVPL
jgi:hypothetical protein